MAEPTRGIMWGNRVGRRRRDPIYGTPDTTVLAPAAPTAPAAPAATAPPAPPYSRYAALTYHASSVPVPLPEEPTGAPINFQEWKMSRDFADGQRDVPAQSAETIRPGTAKEILRPGTAKEIVRPGTAKEIVQLDTAAEQIWNISATVLKHRTADRAGLSERSSKESVGNSKEDRPSALVPSREAYPVTRKAKNTTQSESGMPHTNVRSHASHAAPKRRTGLKAILNNWVEKLSGRGSEHARGCGCRQCQNIASKSQPKPKPAADTPILTTLSRGIKLLVASPQKAWKGKGGLSHDHNATQRSRGKEVQWDDDKTHQAAEIRVPGEPSTQSQSFGCDPDHNGQSPSSAFRRLDRSNRHITGTSPADGSSSRSVDSSSENSWLGVYQDREPQIGSLRLASPVKSERPRQEIGEQAQEGQKRQITLGSISDDDSTDSVSRMWNENLALSSKGCTQDQHVPAFGAQTKDETKRQPARMSVPRNSPVPAVQTTPQKPRNKSMNTHGFAGEDTLDPLGPHMGLPVSVARKCSPTFKDTCNEQAPPVCSQYPNGTDGYNEQELAEKQLARAAMRLSTGVVEALVGHSLEFMEAQDGTGSPKRTGTSRETVSHTSAGSHSRKRGRDGATKSREDKPFGGDGDSNNSDEEDRQKRRKAKEFDGKGCERRLRCPFYSNDPEKYGTKQACSSGLGFPDMPKLMQHLKRNHLQPQRCPRCQVEKTSSKDLANHLRNSPLCPLLPEPEDDRITRQDWEELVSTKPPDYSLKTVEEKWTLLYEALFPHTQRTPSPYEKPIMIHQLEDLLAKTFEVELAKRLGPTLSTVVSQLKGMIPVIIQQCKDKLNNCSMAESSYANATSRQTDDIPSTPIQGNTRQGSSASSSSGNGPYTPTTTRQGQWTTGKGNGTIGTTERDTTCICLDFHNINCPTSPSIINPSQSSERTFTVQLDTNQKQCISCTGTNGQSSAGTRLARDGVQLAAECVRTNSASSMTEEPSIRSAPSYDFFQDWEHVDVDYSILGSVFRDGNDLPSKRYSTESSLSVSRQAGPSTTSRALATQILRDEIAFPALAAEQNMLPDFDAEQWINDDIYNG